MKLSKETISILKNFSQISDHLALQPGNIISTISPTETLVVVATIQEELPSTFGIYDLSEFLGAISLFEDPDVMFDKNLIRINQDNNSIKYYETEISLLHIPKLIGNTPGIVSKFPPPEISFELSNEQLQTVLKTTSVLKSADILISSDGTNLKLTVGDKKNSTASKFELGLGENDMEFNAYLQATDLKLIPGNYKVDISTKSLTRWTNKDNGMIYFVGLTKDSKFN